MNTKSLRSTKECTPIEFFLPTTSKPCPHPRIYKNRHAKPDVNCSMLVTTNILDIQWFIAMALFCRCCLVLPVFRKSVLCLFRGLGDLAWRAGYSSHGGRRYVVCSSRQRPAPFDWRRMLTLAPYSTDVAPRGVVTAIGPCQSAVATTHRIWTPTSCI